MSEVSPRTLILSLPRLIKCPKILCDNFRTFGGVCEKSPKKVIFLEMRYIKKPKYKLRKEKIYISKDKDLTPKELYEEQLTRIFHKQYEIFARRADRLNRYTI